MVYEGADKLGNLFKNRRERGIPGLPTLSVTLTNGLVPRDSLNRKMETNLLDTEHLLVRKGDIVYNMMRMWQGASGLADRDGLLSPAYVVLAPKKGIDSLYASYLFKSSRLIYLFLAYSYGLTGDRLRLYFNDLKSIPVNIPSLPEQRKIAKILSTWDKAIGNMEALIAAKQKRKKALMQLLLTGNMRFAEFNGEWGYFHLKDIVHTLVSPVDKKTIENEQPVLLCNYTNVYYNIRITKSLAFMRATATEQEISKFSLKKGDVIITKDSETPGDIAIPAFVSDDLGGVVCGYHLAILRPKKDKIDGEFLSYLFSLPKTRYYFYTLATGATRFGLSIRAIEKANFHLPPIDEQQKIAAVLSAADKEITTNQKQLATLKQQKKGLMQQLLTGKKRVNVGKVV